MATKTHTYISELRAQGRQEGRQEGLVESILLVLEGRGLAVTDTQRLRVISCADIEQLENWLRRAGTAESADELLT
jgi:hypothetical protein